MKKLQPNDRIEPKAFPPVTREQLKAYSEASGDFNRIHLDDEVAKAHGLPGAIAHGMISAAFIAERALLFVEEDLNEPGTRLERLQTRFRSKVFPGDVISVSGIIKEASESAFAFELFAKNQRDELVTTGSARFLR